MVQPREQGFCVFGSGRTPILVGRFCPAYSPEIATRQARYSRLFLENSFDDCPGFCYGHRLLLRSNFGGYAPTKDMLPMPSRCTR